jgi:predicted enzyme related to lactoylglutathione lyase
MAANPVYFWEINARDGKKLAAFYRDVFSWEMDYEDANEFHTVHSQGADGKGIPGGIFTGKGALPPHRALYVRVDSVEDTAAAAEKAGGKIVLEPFDGPGVRLCFVEDLEGHVVGLVGELDPDAKA